MIAERLLDTTTRANPIDSTVPPNTPASDTTKIADFLTIQSLTYSGGLLVIGLLWRFIQAQTASPLADTLLIPGVLAAGLMLAGFANSYRDLEFSSKRLAAAIIATFNGLLLVAGALGFKL